MHLSADGHLHCFHFLAIVDNPAINLWMWKSPQWMDFIYVISILQSVELTGHMVVVFLVFWETSMYIFHNDCTNLHSQQQCAGFPFPLHNQHLSSVVFFIIANLNGVTWFLIMGFIRISFVNHDTEYFFMCSLTISMSSIVHWIIWFCCYCCFVFAVELFKLLIYSEYQLFVSSFCLIFPLFCKALELDEIPPTYFYFYFLHIWSLI